MTLDLGVHPDPGGAVVARMRSDWMPVKMVDILLTGS